MSSGTDEGPIGPTALPLVGPTERAAVGPGAQGGYWVVRELGSGAFGTVYRAEEKATGDRVAIRLLPDGLAGTPHAVEAVQRISRSIVHASTAHPGLVRVREFGEADEGRPFVAMELVEGRRLSEILSTGEPLDIGVALGLSLDLGGALEALHNLGLVHGAIRPCNVMVLEDGHVKLMDVELAGLRVAPAMDGVITAQPPVEYRSPEQIRETRLTEKTDVYTFAVLLYEMFCGVPPFRAATSEAVLAKHLTETPAGMRRRRPAVPIAVERMVRLALDKEPERRPFMADLLNSLWGAANTQTPRWKRAAVIVGGAAAASCAALVAWSLFSPRPSALRALAQSTPLLAAEQAPVSVSKTSAPAAAMRVAPAARPASPVVEPSAAVNSSAESRDYWIQVGAFKDPDAAKQLAVRLRKQDYRVEESSGSGYGDVLHRVRVGPYADRTTAAAALKALVGKGYKPFIAKR